MKMAAFHSSLCIPQYQVLYCTSFTVPQLWFSTVIFLFYNPLVQLIQNIAGLIFPELFYDRGNHHEFTSLVRDLARPGELTQSTTYDFEFVNVEKPYETYTGANVRLR